MSLIVSAQTERLVEAKLASGDYENADDLISDALAALDELLTRHAELKASLAARSQSAKAGLAQPLDIEEFLVEARERRTQRIGAAE
jgi:Arc/MetJ-type ribon-helix-helix transcriptional regulator